MTQALISQALIGISVAAILILVALGLAVIFGIAGVINMAHGQFIMVGAYTAAIVGQLGGNTFIAIPVAFVVVALLGLIVERGIIRWIYDRPLETLLATWGVGIILEVIVKLIFGSELYYVGAPGSSTAASADRPAALSLLSAVPDRPRDPDGAAVFYIIFKTKFGLKVRAVRRNRAMAGCLGINTAGIDMLIFMYGSGLAGIAGAVLAPIKSVSTTMGFSTRSTPTWSSCWAAWAICSAYRRRRSHRRSRDAARLHYNTVIGELLVFIFIVIAIRVFPRGIFGFHERR